MVETVCGFRPTGWLGQAHDACACEEVQISRPRDGLGNARGVLVAAGRTRPDFDRRLSELLFEEARSIEQGTRLIMGAFESTEFEVGAETDPPAAGEHRRAISEAG